MKKRLFLILTLAVLAAVAALMAFAPQLSRLARQRRAAEMQNVYLNAKKTVVVQIDKKHGPDTVEMQALYGSYVSCTGEFYDDELKQICARINDAIGEPVQAAPNARELCTITARDGYGTIKWYTLARQQDGFVLTAQDGNLWSASHRFDEDAALALYEMVVCDHPALTPTLRERLCDPEQVISATLTQRPEEEVTASLSEEQIQTLCAHLQEHLLPLQMNRTFGVGVALPRGGWSIDFALTDGCTYRLLYQGVGQYRLLLGLVKAGSPLRWISYELEEDNPFDALPQLLEDAP